MNTETTLALHFSPIQISILLGVILATWCAIVVQLGINARLAKLVRAEIVALAKERLR
jgi:hypothetical protein